MGWGAGIIRKGGEKIRNKTSEEKARHAAWPWLGSSQRANSSGEPKDGEKEQGEGRARVPGWGGGGGHVLPVLLMGSALLPSEAIVVPPLPTQHEGTKLPRTHRNYQVKTPAFHAGGTTQARIVFFPVRLPR